MSGRRFSLRRPLWISIADVCRAHFHADAYATFMSSCRTRNQRQRSQLHVENYERRCTDPWMLLDGGENITPSCWRRTFFPEARLFRAISSMKPCRPTSLCTVTIFSKGADVRAKAYTESVARCIRTQQSRNLGPRVVTISDSPILGENIDIVTVEN